MLIYSAYARRVVAINGNMRRPPARQSSTIVGSGLKLVPHSGLLAAGVPAAFDALVTALRNSARCRSQKSSSRRSRSR